MSKKYLLIFICILMAMLLFLGCAPVEKKEVLINIEGMQPGDNTFFIKTTVTVDGSNIDHEKKLILKDGDETVVIEKIRADHHLTRGNCYELTLSYDAGLKKDEQVVSVIVDGVKKESVTRQMPDNGTETEVLITFDFPEYVQDYDEVEIDCDMPATMSFASLEEFNNYLENGYISQENEGRYDPDLASLKRYYLPTNIPENYKLYKITTGTDALSFWYLPEDCLVDDQTRFSSEANKKHFVFYSPRIFDHVDEENVAGEIPTHCEVNRGKFDTMLSWICEKARVELYLPKDIANGEWSDEYLIENFCGAEVIYVK